MQHKPSVTTKTSVVKKDVKRLVANIARMDARKIKESANIRDELGIDSLAAMEILAAIEKRLGIVIDEAKAFDVVTVKDLIDLVMFYLKKKKR
ncbi:MAG: acyl carrier protein [Candidatus Omnitrophica bacterium]|nr:acyl carrier protein [Candidatus Omnitrophota bacterium]